MSYGSLTRVRLSMQAQSGSAARTVAEQMQAKLDAGKTLSAEDRGRLAQANPQEAAKMLQQSAGKVRLATPQVNVGNDDVRWQQAQRLAGVTGRNIVFYNGSPNENGYFDRKAGEIYVNANGGDPAVQTFAHELAHSTEMAEVYKDLQKICFQKLQSLGQDIGQMRKDKMALYEREGHPLQNESEADQEILASFVEQYLLTDEQVIADVVYDDPGIGRRILNWIDRILAKLGNESAQERLFLQNARSLYSKALQQTRNRPWRQGENVSDSGTNQAAAQGNPEMEASIQEMQEALERGDLTEDEYNVIVENIRQEFQRRRNAGRQYSMTDQKNDDVQTQNRYQNFSLAQDGYVYTYDFLTSLPDMNVVTVADVNDIRDPDGKIESARVVDLGRKNALSVGTERDGEIFVKNRYTGRELAITTAAIRHGLNGDAKRLLTNARLGSVIGEIVQNAVPINALYNTASVAEGTYAMAGLR